MKTYYPSVHSCADTKKEGETMELSYIERRLVQAHREGAKIHVNYHDNESLDEAIERMQRFGKITDYKDIESSKSFYITSHVFEKLGVTAAAFLDK